MDEDPSEPARPRSRRQFIGSLHVVQLQIDGPLEGHFRWSVVVGEDRNPADVDSVVLESLVAGLVGGPVQLWVRDVDHDDTDAAVRSVGFEPYRDLWQLQCPLPAAASGLETRAFTPADIDEFVAVNNRAFDWHPEQGDLTRASVETSMAQPWFDADGFRLLHDADELIGFCWTKVHASSVPPLGEVYVIAVDPSRHGRGLGKPMTLAGLEWLAARGLRHGMLYVESDNDAANATYEAIGFSRHHTDRAYRLERS